MAGNIDMATKNILGLPEPTTDTQAATKHYVDAATPAGVTIVRKTADETVNNSNLPQNDDELFLPVLANEVWVFQLYLKVATTAVADFKAAFTVPAGATLSWYPGPPSWSLSPWDNAGMVENFLTGTNRTNAIVTANGVYVGGANAGNLQFRWAQNTAEATDTKVLKNSCLIAFKAP